MAPNRAILVGLLALAIEGARATMAEAQSQVTKYVRFQAGNTIAYGIIEGDRVRQLSGDLFGSWKKTQTTHGLKEVKLLVPSQPRQVLALAGNYRSHLGEENTITTTVTTTTKVATNVKTQKTTEKTTSVSETVSGNEIPKRNQIPQPFYKTLSSLVPDGAEIVIPKDSKVVHFEAELVIVIGKQARKVSKERALDYVLGVTCGNDVSERVWQKADVQWWRAKGSETFGPCGPCIVSGLNYDDLLLQLRVNGKTLQKERTAYMIHSVPAIVSFISHHLTLYPGDLIFTGTPGETSEIKPGDVVEVELEGVGVLKNPVVAAQGDVIENSIGMKLVSVPSGEFMMGSSDDDFEKHLGAEGISKRKKVPNNQQPQHRVRITKAFYMGMYEVTQAEYERVMGRNSSSFSKSGNSREAVAGMDTSRFPVENVSWDDAQEFCRRLSALEAEKRPGRRYRLPTEAEWEYACRAGTTTVFHFGDVSDGRQSNVDGNSPFGTTKRGPFLKRTTTVGSYGANAFGLFDMHGNVWEWCEDTYDERFYEKRVTDDPVNATRGELRVMRGGSWYDRGSAPSATHRNHNSPGFRNLNVGFRVCAD